MPEPSELPEVSELPVVAVLVAEDGQEDVVRQALRGLVAPALADEGCLAFELFESATAPGTFVVQERWRSQGDLDAHLRSEHVQEALVAAGGALASPPGIHPLLPVG